MQRWLYSRYSTVNPFFWLLVHLKQYLVVLFDSESESFTILFSESGISLSFILLRDLLAILDKSLWFSNYARSESSVTLPPGWVCDLSAMISNNFCVSRPISPVSDSRTSESLRCNSESLRWTIALSLRRLPSRFYWIHSLFCLSSLPPANIKQTTSDFITLFSFVSNNDRLILGIGFIISSFLSKSGGFSSNHDVRGFGTGRFWFILGVSLPSDDRNSGPEVLPVKQVVFRVPVVLASDPIV